MALTKADKDYIAAAIVAGIEVALAQRPAVSAPATATASAPVADADPEAGMGYADRRAYALTHKVAGRYCDGKGTHNAHGFAFPKACSR